MNWIKCKDAMPDRKMRIIHYKTTHTFPKPSVIHVFEFDPEVVSWDGWLHACSEGGITHWCEMIAPEKK